MRKRKLGRQGLEVPAMGLGCMGMSWAYGPSDQDESLRVLHRALDLGINFWDTAEVYGPFTNEELLGRALKGKRREDIIIATKFAFAFNAKNEMTGFDSSPAHIRQSIEGSLRRLGTDYIDLYYQHRLDTNTPIEDTVGALAELVKAGKVRYIGLSEVGPGTIRRAHSVHPLSAVQTEYSFWERSVEEKVLPALRNLGIGLVAYSPIGRGYLSGKIEKYEDFDQNDFRRNHPRFQTENLDRNRAIVNAIEQIARANQVTPAQVAIAWVLRRGDDIVPIPGTKRLRYLEENAGAADLKLPESAWQQLDDAASSLTTHGLRYAAPQLQAIDTAD